MHERFARAPIGILGVSPDGTVRELNERAGELLDTEPAAAAGASIETVFPESVEASVLRSFDNTPTTETTVEEYYPGPDRWLSVSIVSTSPAEIEASSGAPADDSAGTGTETETEAMPETVTLYVQEVTDRHRDERRLDRLRGDIDRLTVTNELISDILGELVDASTREEIAETICARLGETEIYDFAWVGERELGGDSTVVRAAAGTTGRTFEQIEAALETGVSIPEARAIETGTPEIVQPIGADGDVPETIRRAAFADGLQSLLAVPLVHGTSVYGVVGLYATDQSAFSARERSSFGTVGEMAGFAVNAARHRNLLLSDTLVELRLQIDDRDDPLVAATAGHDAALSLDGVVPQGDALLCYLTVDTGTPDAVGERLRAHDATGSVRVVGDDPEDESIEGVLRETTVLARLVARGATVRSGTFDQTGGEVVTDLSPGEDVRRLVAAVTEGYDASVVAKRERQREVTTTREFREALGERLTDRQRTALKTAFLADYFESPRESTAEEVAEALDITGPTLLYHLRAGQRKLLAEVFDTDGDPR